MKTDFTLYIFTLLEFTDSFIFCEILIYIYFPLLCYQYIIISHVFGCTITLSIYIQLRLITNYPSLAAYFVNTIQWKYSILFIKKTRKMMFFLLIQSKLRLFSYVPKVEQGKKFKIRCIFFLGTSLLQFFGNYYIFQ